MQRYWPCCVLLTLIVAGCSKKLPPPPAAAAASQAPRDAAEVKPAARSGPVYGGLTASEWDQRLQQSEAAAQIEASRALANLGEDGYLCLLKGLESDSSATRLVCLQAIPMKTLVDHEPDTRPLVRKLLDDRSKDVRRAALTRLEWYGKLARDDIPTLQRLRSKDPDPGVRRAAQEAIDVIEKAKGKPPAG